ncbi:MAG: hypothetical protein JO006_11490 [Paucibacter sp.]|nr:hypothetical protein [Roseateles sp.]
MAVNASSPVTLDELERRRESLPARFTCDLSPEPLALTGFDWALHVAGALFGLRPLPASFYPCLAALALAYLVTAVVAKRFF